MNGKIELLAPAGNYNKLETALNFGADAVYAGGKDFSLRSYAANFDGEELELASKACKAAGKKLYVTANIFARNADFEKAGEYFCSLKNIGIDALIINDAGLISLAKKCAPGLELHLSTQANTLNKHTVKFWAENGIKRVVLARELTLDEIREIKDFNPDTELEAFVHGAMCISYSGRCLLSNYLSGRDSNRGECVQSCRWEYEIREKAKGGGWLSIEEDEKGSYILNSKDLNMSAHIPQLAQAGISSFKIEGRMKSEYYIATVVNAYRRALDSYYLNGKNYNTGFDFEKELAKTAHREYTKAYYLGDNEKTVNYKNSQSKGTYSFICVVTQNSCGGYVQVEMRNRFMTGDVLEILSPDGNFNKSFEVTEICDMNNNQVTDAKNVQQLLYVKCPYELKKGTILRKKYS